MTYKHKANEEDEDSFEHETIGKKIYPGEKEEFEELKQFIEQPFPKKDKTITKPRDFDYITDPLESSRDQALEVHEIIGLLGDAVISLVELDLEIGELENRLTTCYQRQRKLRGEIGQELWAELEKRAKTRLAFKE